MPVQEKKLNLEVLHPYQLRHGGATDDLSSRCRDHNGVKSRGRWENRQFCEKICKDRQSTGASDSVRATADQLLQVGRDISGEMLPRPSASTPCIADFPDVLSMRNKKHLFALEIFAGTARVSQALAQIGHTMYPLDMCIFPSHNVLDPHVEGKILSWISSGRVWLGMPCTTFSCARKK